LKTRSLPEPGTPRTKRFTHRNQPSSISKALAGGKEKEKENSPTFPLKRKRGGDGKSIYLGEEGPLASFYQGQQKTSKPTEKIPRGFLLRDKNSVEKKTKERELLRLS